MNEKLLEFKNKSLCLSDAYDVFDLLETYEFNDDEMREALSFIQTTMEDLFENGVVKPSGKSNTYESSTREDFYTRLFRLLCEYNYADAKGYFISHTNAIYTKGNFDEFIKLAKETRPNAKNHPNYNERLNYPIDILHDNCGSKFIYDLVLKNIDPLSQIDVIKELSYLTEEEIEKHYNTKFKYHFSNIAGKEKVHLKLLYEKDPNLFIDTLTRYSKDIVSGDRVKLIDFGMRYATGFRYSKNEERFLEVDFSKIKKNDLLATLTRGELQNFLVSSRINPNLKLDLLNSARVDLFKDDDPKKFYSEVSTDLIHAYFSYLDYMKDNFNFEFEIRNRSDFDDEIDEESEKYKTMMNSYNKLYELELKNLRIILQEKNLAKRFKMLSEAMDYKENYEAYKETEFSDSRQKFYFEFLEDTIKEFYSSIGMDYDKISVNENSKVRDIYYGIEIEEAGFGEELYATNRSFNCHHDGSISKVQKGDKAFFDDDYSHTGEYVNDLALASSIDDLEDIKEQSKILSFLGGRPNYTCGFHIHVSSEYTDNADTEELCKKISFPDSYDPEIDSEGVSRDAIEYYEERYKLDGFEMPYRVSNEIYDMQKVLARKFLVFYERFGPDSMARLLDDRDADVESKYKFVNLKSLTEGKGVEFRFFNLPDYIDHKVIESYVDFATSYFAYMEEGNNTLEYVNESIDEAFGEKAKYLSFKDREDIAFDVLLEELDLKEDTVKVIKNLDKIFEFYGTKEEGTAYNKSLVDREEIDYYTKIDKSILDECEISEDVNDEANETSELIEL